MKQLVVVFAGAALLATPAMAQDNGTLKAIGEGRAIYLANCAPCHGAHLKGTSEGTNGEGIPDLTLIAARDGEFRAVHIVNHIEGRRDGMSRKGSMPSMPNWHHAFREEWPRGRGAGALKTWKLAKYLAFAQEQAAPPQQVASK